MTFSTWTENGGLPAHESASAIGVANRAWRRRLLVAAMVAGAAWAAFATGPADRAAAVAQAGEELTRVLRFMAIVKATMAIGVSAGVWWRLVLPVTPGRLFVYLAAGAAMAAGPVLVWDMAHVGLGALLLHGGLIAALVVLWRDPDVAARLGAMVAARRRAPSPGVDVARLSDERRGSGS